MVADKKRFTIKPISIAKAVVIYVICAVLIIGMLVGNYYADVYRELITVYMSGSGTVSSKEAEAVCLEVEQEGMVLLKNEGGLPLSDKAKITLLGQDSVDFVYGGAGSGSVDTSRAKNLREAMEEEGFSVNPVIWDFYSSGAGKSYRKTVPDETGEGEFAVNEVPAEVYTEKELGSFKDYSDAAIVCIGRSGGESADIPTTPLASGSLYLQLDQAEQDLLTIACEAFENVIVVVNANNPMELGFLEDPSYKNVKACLWVGGVGQEGIRAVAQAVSGSVNPSGHLADTYAYSSVSAPSVQNLGSYDIENSSVKNGTHYLVYAEDIYVGYRYYETRYEDAVMGQGNAGDYSYKKTVQFPFGYGLSYTDFEWSDYKVKENNDSFEISVTVTNTGAAAGKDVVEVYLQSPYTDYDRENQIEKASVELAGFEKTSLLEPGKSETVKITVDKESLKTYDAHNQKTYILDAGEYYLAAGSDAHEALNNILASKGYSKADGMNEDGDADFAWKYEVKEQDNETYVLSAATGAPVTNQFENADISYYDGSFKYLSRSDWEGTYPSTYMDGKWQAPEVLLKDLEWNRDASVTGTGAEAMPEFGNGDNKKLSDLTDKEYDDEAWDKLILQLDADKAMSLVRLGGYATIQIDGIGLPSTQDKDGPSGISGTLVGGQSAMAYPVEVVMASTWNRELIERMGESVGEDSIQTEVAGWYAPGVNIHRSPYSGRNFEYFSEDGFLSGKMSSAEVKGCRSKGVITYMKHFALNDQETNRYGAAIFADEQAIREVFLKGFEYTVKEGRTNAAMAAMNRIGCSWAGAHKGLMTNVLRDEWGFEGCVITDQASVPAMFYQDIISGLAAGTDLWLNTNKNYWKLDAYTEADGSVKDWSQNAYVMQNVERAAKNVAFAVGGSNAMAKANEKTMPALWELLLVILDILIYGGSLLMMIWTTLRLVKTMKNRPAKEEKEGEDIVRKPIVALLTVLALLLGIGGGCLIMKNKGQSADASAKTAEIVRTSVYGEIAGNAMNDNDYIEYELTLYDDGTYKFTTTTASNGYSMLLSNTVVTAYGNYTMGASSDGQTACELGEADRILYSGYSDVGGYNMSYDTKTLTFPVELPGGIQTEQADFQAQFGPARSIMLDDSNVNRMSFETGSLPPAASNEAAASNAEGDAETEAKEASEDTALAEEGAEAAETASDTEAAAETDAEPTELFVITSDDGATALTFYDNSTVKFTFDSYHIEEMSEYRYDMEKKTLIVTNENGLEMVSEGSDPMKLHYVSAKSDQLTGDFTIDLSAMMG